MKQEVTLSLEESHIHFIKELAEKKGTTPSEIIDGYLELFQDIEDFHKKRSLHPWVQEFAGIVNTGKEETKETIFE